MYDVDCGMISSFCYTGIKIDVSATYLVMGKEVHINILDKQEENYITWCNRDCEEFLFSSLCLSVYFKDSTIIMFNLYDRKMQWKFLSWRSDLWSDCMETLAGAPKRCPVMMPTGCMQGSWEGSRCGKQDSRYALLFGDSALEREQTGLLVTSGRFSKLSEDLIV